MMKRIFKLNVVIIMIIAMLAPTVLNVHASEGVVDMFYILDENGKPEYIQVVQNDFDEVSTMTVSDDVEEETPEETPEEETPEETLEEETPEEETPEEETPEEETPELTEDGIGIIRFSQDVSAFEFEEVDTGRNGYLSTQVTSDAAYIRKEDDGVVCKVAGAVIKVDMEYVGAFESYETAELSYYYASNGYMIHKYGYYSGGELCAASTRVGYTPSYFETDVNYYSYDGHYFYESFETMIGDYRNDTYINAVNADEPYYNYYQYVSLHTTATFTGEQYNEFVASRKDDSVMLNTGDEFVDVQNQYTINALIMFSIAVNESGWGTSSLARNKNNLFGLNAADDNPYESGNEFSSTKACIEDFAYRWMHTGYLNGTDSRYRGAHLGDKHSGINVKYASDPYWGEKAAGRTYYDDPDKQDYGRYTLGIATTGILELYNEPDTDSTVIYTSEVGNGGHLYDYSVTILDTVTNSDGETFYKVVSDMSLNDDRSARNVEGIFDISRDYVYAKASDIKIVFEGTGEDDTIVEPEEEITLPFTDVEEDAWYIEAVKYVYERGYMTGRSETTFVPDGNLTRAEFATILYRIEGEPEVEYEDVFQDVEDEKWYSNAIVWANENEIVTGYGNGYFGIDDEITREQMAVMMYRYANYKGYDTSVQAEYDDFQDAEEVSSWAEEAMQWAVGNEIITGKKVGDDLFLDPLGQATRAECATIIMRFEELYEE